MNTQTNRIVYQPHNSSIGNVDARFMVLVCYIGPILIGMIPEAGSVLAWILPLVILFMEKSSPLVRFSAAQSLMFSIVSAVLHIILWIVSIPLAVVTLALWIPIAFLISWAINIAVWIFLIIAAYHGFAKLTAWEAPLVGRWSRKLESKIGPANPMG